MFDFEIRRDGILALALLLGLWSPHFTAAAEIAHWPFSEGSGLLVADASGHAHDGQIESATWTTGFDGGALDFSDPNAAVVVASSSALDQPLELSFVAWVRQAAGGNYSSIVDKRDSGTDGYDFYLDHQGRVFVRVNSSTLVGATVVTDQQWHHVAGVWDGSSISLYVDGVLDRRANVPATAVSVDAPLLIGRHFQSLPQFGFKETLDEIRIFDSALSTVQIQELLDGGGSPGGDQAPPIRSAPEPSAALPSGTAEAMVSLGTDEPAECRWADLAGVGFAQMTQIFGVTGATSHSQLVSGLQDGDSRSFFVRCADATGNTNPDDLEIVVAVAEPGPSLSGPVGHWPFSEGVGALTLDATGNGHDGTLVNQPSWSDGWGGVGLAFQGADDGVVIGSIPELADLDALSISAWIRHAPPSDYASIVDQRDRVADGYDLYLDPAGRPFFRINGSTMTGTTPISDRQWHHLAAVWDGASMTIYLDGAAQSSQVVAGTTVRTTAPLLIGTHFAADSRFQSAGSIDEVRVYDRAVSPTEVLSLATPDGPLLTLASGYPDKHVVQRVGTAGGLPLAGTYFGSPTAIEARLIEADSGLPLPGLGWTIVDPTPSGGSWSGSLAGLPQGGWYRLELRFAGDPGVSLNPPSRLGVGMVIAALGQSSMAKLFTEIAFVGDGDLGVASLDFPGPLTARVGYGHPRQSQTVVGGYLRSENDPGQISRGPVTGAGAIRMANQLADELLIPILVLDFAIDGTSILQWTDESWHRRQTFDSALETAGGDFELMLWFQGGSDILDDMAAPLYQSNLNLFYDQMQALLPSHRALELFVAIQGRGDYSSPHDEAYREIRAVQFDWAEQHASVHHAGSAIDLHLAASSYSRGDGHFTASQMQVLGDRYTRAILHWSGQIGFEGGVRGGQVESAIQIGSEVRVRFSHDQGSALTVPDSGADIEGFELSDNGFQTIWRLGDGIVSATLSADQQDLVLTLDQVVTGPLRLRYLYGMNAFRHKTTESDRRRNGNTVLDNFEYHPDRVGLPINPTRQDVVVSTIP